MLRILPFFLIVLTAISFAFCVQLPPSPRFGLGELRSGSFDDSLSFVCAHFGLAQNVQRKCGCEGQ
jgi:hypothetical protein